MDLFWSLQDSRILDGAGVSGGFARLLDETPARRFDEGAVLSDPYARPERTFYCRSGTLKVTKLLSSGREILITILQAGSLWSDRAILNGYWREVFVEAMGPCDVVIIENTAFEAFLRNDPARFTAFMQRISEQVSDALTLLDDFRGRDVASRLARVLVRFSEQYGTELDSGAVRIELPMTHQDLANMIGTARETVSRNMARFRQKGYVRDAATGQALELLDLRSLQSLIV